MKKSDRVLKVITLYKENGIYLSFTFLDYLSIQVQKMANISEANHHSFIVFLQLLFVIITVLTLPVVGKSFETTDSDNPTSFYKECTRNTDCPITYCCTVGMMRYTMPFCSPLGTHMEPCRPDNEKQNITLSFPKFEMEVIDSYLLLCPCTGGLQCSRSSATCVTQDKIHEELLQ